MAKFSAIVQHDPAAQMTKTFHRLEDGDWAYEVSQDCSDIAKDNENRRNHHSPWTYQKDWRHDAEIPLIYLDIWQKRYGVNFLSPDPDQQAAVDRLLDSSEWRWLRTSTATLSKLKVSKKEIERKLESRRRAAEAYATL